MIENSTQEIILIDWRKFFKFGKNLNTGIEENEIWKSYGKCNFNNKAREIKKHKADDC